MTFSVFANELIILIIFSVANALHETLSVLPEIKIVEMCFSGQITTNDGSNNQFVLSNRNSLVTAISRKHIMEVVIVSSVRADEYMGLYESVSI